MDDDNKSRNSSFYAVNSTKRANLNFHYILGSNQPTKFIADIGNLSSLEKKKKMVRVANIEEKIPTKKIIIAKDEGLSFKSKIAFDNVDKICRNSTPVLNGKNISEKNEKNKFETQKSVRKMILNFLKLIKGINRLRLNVVPILKKVKYFGQKLRDSSKLRPISLATNTALMLINDCCYANGIAEKYFLDQFNSKKILMKFSNIHFFFQQCNENKLKTFLMILIIFRFFFLFSENMVFFSDYSSK